MRIQISGNAALAIILAFAVAVGLVIGIVIQGGAWLADKLYPLLAALSSLTLGVTVMVLIPLSLLRRTRVSASAALTMASNVFGATLWIWAFLLTYKAWGAWGVALGLLLLGVGVVPLAALATLFDGMWPELGGLLALTLLVIAVRGYGAHVGRKAISEAFPD